MAKKMIDTKNFYGGSLHVCYAPEFESLEQTRQKILQRKRDIIFRLNNLRKEREEKKFEQVSEAENNANKITVVKNKEIAQVTDRKVDNVKLNMGEINTIGIGKQTANVGYKDKGKRKMDKDTFVIEKRFKPSLKDKDVNKDIGESSTINNENNLLLDYTKDESTSKIMENGNSNCSSHNFEDKNIDIVDFTATDTETISNINEALNYNKFGNEVIRKVESKPLNKIKFNLGNKK